MTRSLEISHSLEMQTMSSEEIRYNLRDVQHFTGILQIVWDGGGGYIEGTYAGKVVWSEGRYVLNGQITVTSDNWAHLNGLNIHIMGTIDMSLFPYTTNAILQIN